MPTIEPDTRGATTIRQQLEKHRNIEACADCHANIDPWGFPLENYDPIGKLRQYYPHKNKNKHVKIDSVGIFKNGNKVKSLNDMNKAILDKEALFTRNLIKKMVAV